MAPTRSMGLIGRRWVRLKEEAPWEGIGTQAEGLAAAFGRSTSFPLGPALPWHPIPYRMRLDHPVDHPDDPTGSFWNRLDRRGTQREQARSVWSRPDRRRAPGYGSGGWGFESLAARTTPQVSDPGLFALLASSSSLSLGVGDQGASWRSRSAATAGGSSCMPPASRSPDGSARRGTENLPARLALHRQGRGEAAGGAGSRSAASPLTAGRRPVLAATTGRRPDGIRRRLPTGSELGVGGLGRRRPLRTDRTRLLTGHHIHEAAAVAAVG
jgi:hypothetical protein